MDLSISTSITGCSANAQVLGEHVLAPGLFGGSLMAVEVDLHRRGTNTDGPMTGMKS